MLTNFTFKQLSIKYYILYYSSDCIYMTNVLKTFVKVSVLVLLGAGNLSLDDVNLSLE